MLLLYNGCATETTITYKANTVIEKPSGVYVGGISFADNVKNITGGRLVFLNEEGGLFLVRSIFAKYQAGKASNISLYDAVETAISAVNNQAEFFPNNMETVNLVVFTNRLPAVPADRPLPQMKAAGKDVKIYIAGTGRDIQNPQFTAQLNRLAGNPSQVYKAANYEDLPDVFNEIVSRLNSSSTKSSVVYFVLDSAPPLRESDVRWVQTAAITLLDTLSNHVDLTAPTPVKKILADPHPNKSTTIDWFTTGIFWLSMLLSGGVVALMLPLLI